MHTMSDLLSLIESLESDATKEGFELIVEQSEMDSQLFILANGKSKKVACVGLTEINNATIIASYSINMNKWGWYNAEGFTLDDMVETDNIKKDIFTFLPADEIINYLHE